MTDVTRLVYPEIQPYESGFLAVSDGHEIYYEQSGNPAGQPAVFLHGGPGGGTAPFHRRFFDPEAYRIVLFDQRGAGRSRPHASLKANTTWHLVADMEALRTHLGIDRWQVFGGSWGSTLALAYAETHPDRVASLVLRGIFLLRQKELDWFFQGGAGAIFPEAYDAFVDFIPEAERGDLLKAYHRRVTATDDAVRIPAAQAWSVWEASACLLVPEAGFIDGWRRRRFAEALAGIETHYFVNGGFFEGDSQLLEDADRLKDIPTIIVQGRYDIICPMITAWELKKAMPHAEMDIITGGHAANDPAIAEALVRATDRLADKASDTG